MRWHTQCSILKVSSDGAMEDELKQRGSEGGCVRDRLTCVIIEASVRSINQGRRMLEGKQDWGRLCVRDISYLG